MEKEPTVKEMIILTQELLQESEDEYVNKKYGILEAELKLDQEKTDKFNSLDWTELGITQITKQNKYVDDLFVKEKKEIMELEKEKDELYYRTKQLSRRNSFLMETYKQERVEMMFEEVEE